MIYAWLRWPPTLQFHTPCGGFPAPARNDGPPARANCLNCVCVIHHRRTRSETSQLTRIQRVVGHVALHLLRPSGQQPQDRATVGRSVVH
uniref:Secreted protein n=1 Tax=Steinernema glaseri TaxID=37863 RepID=A0A1I8ADJ1_9BILA